MLTTEAGTARFYFTILARMDHYSVFRARLIVFMAFGPVIAESIRKVIPISVESC